MARSALSWRYIAVSILLIGVIGVILVSLFQYSAEEAPPPDPPSPPAVDTAVFPPPPATDVPRTDPPQPPTANARRSPLATVDEAIAGMDWGNIVFNVPSRLQLGEAHTIQLLLSPSQTVEELRTQIRQGGDSIRDSMIRVSSVMHADLQSSAFDILSITPEIQAISSTEATEWRWEVRGTEPGPKQPLHLTLYAIFEIDGRETPRTIRTFEEIIEVDVTLSQQISDFVGNNWQWLWTAIFLPLAGWIWERWKNRPGGDRKPPSEL